MIMLNTVSQTNAIIHSVDNTEKIRNTDNEQTPQKRIRKRIKYTGPYTAPNRLKTEQLQPIEIFFSK